MKHLIVMLLALLLAGCGIIPEEEPQRVEMVTLRYAVAVEVFDSLKILLGDPPTIRIAPDPRTNSIVVLGTPAEIGLVRELISAMDVKAFVSAE